MRALLSSSLLIVLVACSGTASGQQRAERPGVMDDLCGCMSSIDLRSNDGVVASSVKNCLEEAVIGHPAEVRALLQRSTGQGSRAFQLGSILGGALDRQCAPFRAIRARLQQMEPVKKQGT